MTREQLYALMTRAHLQLSTFTIIEDDVHALRALLCNRDCIFAKHIHGWNPQPPVLFRNNNTTDHLKQYTNGLATGVNVDHSA